MWFPNQFWDYVPSYFELGLLVFLSLGILQKSSLDAGGHPKIAFCCFVIDLNRLPSSWAFLTLFASLTRHCSEHVFQRWFGFKKLFSSYIWLVFEDELTTSYVTKVECFSFFCQPCEILLGFLVKPHSSFFVVDAYFLVSFGSLARLSVGWTLLVTGRTVTSWLTG